MMKSVPRKDVCNELVLLGIGLAAIGVIWATEPAQVHIAAIWVLYLVAAGMTRFDLLHPYTSYGLAFALYGTANAIVWLMGLRAGGYDRGQCLYPLLGMLVVFLFIGPHKAPAARRAPSKGRPVNYWYMDYLIAALSLFSLAAAVILLRRGYSGKSQMIRANDLFYRIGVYTARYSTIFVMLRCINQNQRRKKAVWQIALGAVGCMGFGLATGERDAFIRYFVCMLFVLYSLRKIKKWHFVLLIPLGVVFMGMTAVFKYYLPRGVLRGSFGFETILQNFLLSDFSAAGRNMQYLLESDGTKGLFGLRLLFTELLYPFLPASMKVNPDVWFNYVLNTDSFHGRAFTMVGTGYLIGGAFGVALVFALVGLFIRQLYRRSTRGMFPQVAYLYTLCILMFALRESINTVVNNFLKEIGIAYLVCYAVMRLLRFLGRSCDGQ